MRELSHTGTIEVLPVQRQAAPGRPALPKKTPFISLVIPAHNEEKYLPGTLAAIQEQTFQDFEVIVAGNGCTDRTLAIAREFGAQVLELPERGLSRARNLGARMARGKLLIFVDADTHLSPSALEKAVGEFGTRDAAGTFRGVPDEPKAGFRLLYFWKNLVHRVRLHEGSSGVILCWREHFQQIGGFDEALHVRENSELIRRLRLRGKYRYIGSAGATTSMRRYARRGLIAMVFFWLRLWLQSLFGDIRHKPYESIR